MERRVRGNPHARCEAGEKLEIVSKAYLSLFYLSFRPKGFNQAVDIAAIRDMPDGGDPEGIEMLLFGNLASEDETAKVVLTKKEIREQMLEGGYYEQK